MSQGDGAESSATSHYAGAASTSFAYMASSPEAGFDVNTKGLGLGSISEGAISDCQHSSSSYPGADLIATSSSSTHPSGSGGRTRNGSDATAIGLGYPSSASSQHLSGMHNDSNVSGLQNDDVVQVGFDEGVLRALCGLDCGLPLLLDRLKQALASNREAQTFFRKRAQIEEEYARNLQKLSKERLEGYSALGGEGRAGTFVSSWQSLLRLHDVLADNRLKYAGQLVEIADELAALSREVDRARKSGKDLGSRLEKNLQESEATTEKAKLRFEVAAEELERLIVAKTGESVKDPYNVPHAGSSGIGAGKRTFGKAMSKFKGKNPAQLAKQEDDVRNRMGRESDTYRTQVLSTQQVRQEYFNLQLPRILRTLKEHSDEIDLGSQYQLSRYSFMYENLLISDGLTLSPLNIEDGPGLKSVVEAIDNREDFRTFMSNYAAVYSQSVQRGPRREGPADEGFLPPMFPAQPRPSISSPRGSMAGVNNLVLPNGTTMSSTTPTVAINAKATFGVDLGEQMTRDGVEVPKILQKCAQVIEEFGLEMIGIYRLSGTTSRVQRLRAKLDRDVDGTNLKSDENLTDINDISGVLKLWLRELPEPLMTWDLYHSIIEAARIENDRLRHIRLHERVNELPDSNYAALKFLMGHLDKVKQHEAINSMGCSNLAVIFGPNLLGPPPSEGQGSALADMSAQCRAIETILEHYREIFVDEGD